MDINKLVRKYKHCIIEYRRYFHMHPEVSFQEYNTCEKIIEELKNIGVECYKCGKTGVVALINGKNSGKCIALRADIDALEVEEKTGLPFSSINKGVSHACGHDMHTAMLLGAVKVINDIRDEINGTVKFIL